MSELSDDMLDLLKGFNARGVEYLIVGGHAVNAYTEPRGTKDIDVWVKPEMINAQKVFEALAEFGAPLEGLSVEDFTDEESFFIIGINPNRIDILKKIPGLEFAGAYQNRETFALKDVRASFLSLDDLILAKQASARPQDIADVEKLKKAKMS